MYYLSQYSQEMINDLWFHVTMTEQRWRWRGAGDFNGDGAVNIDDFVILKNNFDS